MTRPLSARQVRRRLESAGFVRGREFTVDRRERGVDIQGGGMADQILVVTL